MTTTTITEPDVTRRLTSHHADVFGVLERDWEGLAAGVRGRRVLASWARRHPLLAPHTSLEGLDPHLDRLAPGHADPYLRALLTEAQQGDRMAVRVLVHRFRFVALSLARHYRPALGSAEDAAAATLTVLCGEIARYPLDRRPQRVAANLALDTRKRLHAACSRARPATVPLDVDVAAVAGDEHPAAQLLGLLAEAVSLGRLQPAAAWLVAATTVGGVAQQDAARQLGVCDREVRRRLRRAVTTLADLAVAS